MSEDLDQDFQEAEEGTEPRRSKRSAKADKSAAKNNNRTKPANTTPRHSTKKPGSPVGSFFKFLGATAAVVAISATSVAAYTVYNITDDIDTVDLINSVPVDQLPQIGAMENGTNILVVGSDVRERTQTGSELNDVTMLIHIAKDKSNVVAVSFPRDLIVPIPSCKDPKTGYSYSSMSAQPMNVTLMYGGLACTVATVENLTGLTIPYAAMITFSGVTNMTKAIGGVNVCVGATIDDRQSKLYLKPGEHTLTGQQALAFLRTRKTVGDGSDTGRIGLQQSFLSSLIKKVKSNDTLTDPTKLYSLAKVASQQLSLSKSLASPDALVSLALILKDVDLNKISFITYPNVSGRASGFPNKVVPNHAAANEVFDLIKADKPVIPQKNNTAMGTTIKESGKGQKSNVSGAVKGQTAADTSCTRGYIG